jgi:hypothetical protein
MQLNTLPFSTRALVLFGLVILCGCSSGERVYQLSGNITYAGKPVPTGHIIFEPDNNAGASGGSGFAKIKDGHYDTSILDGRGVMGGPHIVRIQGLDGIVRGELLNGIPLFQEYVTTADLPKGNGTKDFEVPKKK